MTAPQVLIVGYTIVPTIQVLDDGVLSPPITRDDGGPIASQFVPVDQLAAFVEARADGEAALKSTIAAAWAEQHPKPNRATRRAKASSNGKAKSSAS